jgi:hypothetical protein
LCAPEGECHADEVRKLQRIEEIELQRQDHREQFELEQEQLVQEEVSPAEAARASRLPDW